MGKFGNGFAVYLGVMEKFGKGSAVHIGVMEKFGNGFAVKILKNLVRFCVPKDTNKGS